MEIKYKNLSFYVNQITKFDVHSEKKIKYNIMVYIKSEDCYWEYEGTTIVETISKTLNNLLEYEIIKESDYYMIELLLQQKRREWCYGI